MPQNKPDEYCAYLRKSRTDRDAELQGQGETLARHRTLLLDLSDKIGKHIKKFYCEVVSGDNIADRPVMQEMLRDVENNIWSGVFVVEVERLARGNTKDQGIVSDAFKYSNTKIITLNKTYDPEDEFDEEYFEFGLFMSRREYKTINRRLQRGRIASLKEGKYIAGTPPYGYDKVKLAGEKGYTLTPNQDAATVQMVFDWYCNGLQLPDGTLTRLGSDSIATHLDALGIKPLVNDRWSKSSISDMLKNETYTGKVFFGKQREEKTTKDGNIIKMQKTHMEYLSVQGLHPAIIPQDLFDKTQLIRRMNRKNTVSAALPLQNAFSGIIYCKKCGALITRLAPNSHNKYSTLKCPNKYCDNISSPLFLVEKKVLDFLCDWMKHYRLSQKQNSNIVPMLDSIQVKENALVQLDAEKTGYQNQLSKAYDFLEKGVYTLDIFRERQITLQKSIEELEIRKNDILEELEKLKELQSVREQFAPRVQHLLETYAYNSPTTNNQILKEVLDKVIYEKTERNTRGNLENTNFTLNIYPRVPVQ